MALPSISEVRIADLGEPQLQLYSSALDRGSLH